jgi:acetylglutamate synthase
VQRLGCVLLAIVILLLAWDQWRIEQMRRELRAISSKVHVQQAPKGDADAGKADLVTTLAQVEKHTRRAKELIRRKRTAEAQAELDRALKGLRAANNVSEDIVGDAAEYVGKARDRAIAVFQQAWKDISQEARPKKIDVKK